MQRGFRSSTRSCPRTRASLSIPKVSSFRDPQAEATELFERAAKRAREGDHDKAIQHHERALAIDPLRITGRRDLTMSRMARGDKVGADAELRRLLLLAPADAWAWVILGNLNFRQNFGLAERSPARRDSTKLTIGTGRFAFCASTSFGTFCAARLTKFTSAAWLASQRISRRGGESAHRPRALRVRTHDRESLAPCTSSSA
jgi:tetratricopeptide (TPR) repeat protein